MFGPKDVDGECNSYLYFGDDFGDGTTTMRCQLPVGHEGPHCEKFIRNGGQVIITWEHDERAEREKYEQEREQRWAARRAANKAEPEQNNPQ